MSTILVTGATGFLGYHVVKLLTTRGQRARVLVSADVDRGSLAFTSLQQRDVEVVEGDVDNTAALAAACQGIETVFHLKFAIGFGSGAQFEELLHAGNVVGTRNLLDAAERAGVARVVVSSSSLTVGLNRIPEPLDETADWEHHAFTLPYALSRRQAEIEALNRPVTKPPEIVVLNPSFTLGPEDFQGAPANGLIMKMSKPGFRITAPIGFGVLDVRDYAEGALRAAERGSPGKRYILSGSNVTPEQLLQEVAQVAGIKPARWLIHLHLWIVYPIVAAMALWSRLGGNPPKISRSLLQLWGQYAWYDTSRARAELGWEPRPLRETLNDTISWFRDNRSS